MMEHKWKDCGIIPYFQAHTNTYAPVSVLSEKYTQALEYPDTVGATDWIGLALICFILPALISLGVGLLLRKLGWIKENDLKL
mgnify:CR=1 FL=1